MTAAARTDNPGKPEDSRTATYLVRAAMLAGLIALFAASFGCSTQQMKGTPFFEEDYEKRKGPAEERVNLWPLLYYRSPALSVLWPIGQATDEYVAVRPVFSIYKLKKDRPEVSILWPISDLDFDEHEYRAFPAFWGAQESGEPYAVLFPAAWYI
ncbi:MAG: hypothetical protein V5A84_04530, partial [Planctomycetota bacterium]